MLRLSLALLLVPCPFSEFSENSQVSEFHSETQESPRQAGKEEEKRLIDRILRYYA